MNRTGCRQGEQDAREEDWEQKEDRMQKSTMGSRREGRDEDDEGGSDENTVQVMRTRCRRAGQDVGEEDGVQDVRTGVQEKIMAEQERRTK